MSKPVHNAYPELQELDYHNTSITEQQAVGFLNDPSLTQYPLACRDSAFAIFYIESADGRKGVNGNYDGIQADGSRLGGDWDAHVVGTCLVKENMTGDMRRFVVFDCWENGILYNLDRVFKRGLYIGGYAHPFANMKVTNEYDLALAYGKEWVEGDGKYIMPDNNIKDFLRTYHIGLAKLHNPEKVQVLEDAFNLTDKIAGLKYW